jgi:Rrf2 family transcriptional regulator, nitric oxide-sensitive transcriptional repressor
MKYLTRPRGVPLLTVAARFSVSDSTRGKQYPGYRITLVRLTKQTDYSLRLLIHLGVKHMGVKHAAVKYGPAATIEEVADAYSISRNHLMKVVYHLATHGILETQRGRGGGFRLARDPSRINLGEVVRLTEPDFTVVECFDQENGCCAIREACQLQDVLGRALDAFFAVLDCYTLVDLLEPRSRLAQLLGIEPAPAHRRAV